VTNEDAFDDLKAKFEEMKRTINFDLNALHHHIDVMSASVPDPKTATRSEIATLVLANQFLGMATLLDLIAENRITPDLFGICSVQAKALAWALLSGEK
jgi:hypothetical protein